MALYNGMVQTEIRNYISDKNINSNQSHWNQRYLSLIWKDIDVIKNAPSYFQIGVVETNAMTKNVKVINILCQAGTLLE